MHWYIYVCMCIHIEFVQAALKSGNQWSQVKHMIHAKRNCLNQEGRVNATDCEKIVQSFSPAIAKMHECNEVIISLDCTKSKHLKYGCSSRIQKAIDIVTFGIEIQCLLILVHVVDISLFKCVQYVHMMHQLWIEYCQPINCRFQLKVVLAFTKIIYLLYIPSIYMIHNWIVLFFSKIKFVD